MNIVAPAGNLEKLKAAVKAGASEVYFGLRGFGARRNNENFGIQEILDGIDYAHARGVKTLLTLNTLMKDVEIETAHYNLSRIYEHGIDAVIVQDLGFFTFIKENFPGLAVHGSTQMTVANYEEANFLQKLGLTRVVLARELSFEEIKSIRSKTTIELEVFVSGSLCIAYSGNCYISSFIGGRSGNRGLCAYSCRKKFKDEDGKSAYFLSPNDQFLEKEEINKLKEIGINAIKVEGRKKSPEYVFETVSYYRNVLDNINKEMESYKLFNRGYSKGYFYNDNKLMNFKYSSNFGYLFGERIVSTNNFKLLDNITLGDGVQFVDSDHEKISGEYVNKIIRNDNKIPKGRVGDIISIGKLPEDALYIYKNYSKDKNDEVMHSLKVFKRYADVEAEVYVYRGSNLKLSMTAKNLNGKSVKVQKEGKEIADDAKKPIDSAQIIEKVSELGETSFALSNCKVNYDGTSFFSFSELKELRRQCSDELAEDLVNSYRRHAPAKVNKVFNNIKNEAPIISAYVTTKEQEHVCRRNGITKIYKKQFDVAKESKLDKAIIESNLISNMYQLSKSIEMGLENQSVDWNLNIFNNYSVDLFAQFKNVETIFISPELSYDNLSKIKSDKVKKGLVIYGYLKGMYIEYPIFDKKSKVLTGDYKDTYKIVKNGIDNIELYLNKPMNLIPRLDEIEKLGFDELRLDFVFEKKEEIEEILTCLKTRDGKYNPYAFETGVF